VDGKAAPRVVNMMAGQLKKAGGLLRHLLHHVKTCYATCQYPHIPLALYVSLRALAVRQEQVIILTSTALTQSLRSEGHLHNMPPPPP